MHSVVIYILHTIPTLLALRLNVKIHKNLPVCNQIQKYKNQSIAENSLTYLRCSAPEHLLVFVCVCVCVSVKGYKDAVHQIDISSKLDFAEVASPAKLV